MPLTSSEKRAILDVARGSSGNPNYALARKRAIEAHRRVLQEPGYLYDTPEGRFMSEIDNPCPDLLLRGRYRAELLNEPWPPTRARCQNLL